MDRFSSSTPGLGESWPARGQLALIVDDEQTNRIVLGALLSQAGYRILEAANGLEGVNKFHESQPDIVFMDLMMPIMDGFEATRQIKKLCGQNFVPVIVLTALTDGRALARCVEAGSDDFLTKPYDEVILKSKIRAMERIRDLNRSVTRYLSHLRHDDEIARQIFNRVVVAKNLNNPAIKTIVHPAGSFSGDVVLTAYSPGRDVHIFLGDFTGHGLSAAIGALPTSQLFTSMVDKGFSAHDVVAKINEQIHQLLPTEMFLAAVYMVIQSNLRHAIVFNCGMPDVLVLGSGQGRIKQKVAPTWGPLGIDSDLPTHQIAIAVGLEEGDRLLAVSDGVIEARSPLGEEYGYERLDVAVERCHHFSNCAESIVDDVEEFCFRTPQSDDLTVVEIQCVSQLIPLWKMAPTVASETSVPIPATARSGAPGAGGFEVSMTLQGARLRDSDPIPHLIGQLQDLAKLPLDAQSVYVILTELYTNALDHGVLRLNSAMKETEDGFIDYMAERAKRLAALTDGYVTVTLRVDSHAQGGRIVVRIEDSGAGFNFETHAKRDTVTEHSGRGLGLVKTLCHFLTYEGVGNKVEAVCLWAQADAPAEPVTTAESATDSAVRAPA